MGCNERRRDGREGEGLQPLEQMGNDTRIIWPQGELRDLII